MTQSEWLCQILKQMIKFQYDLIEQINKFIREIYQTKICILHLIDKFLMYPNIKPLITLSNINALPDGHLHSKISFLKSVINEQQNPEIKEMKEKMYKMSYTVKNIGIHGEQIGITSKRMPLKGKDDYQPSQITSEQQKQIFKNKYLPHNTFFSQALVPVKKLKTLEAQQNTQANNPFLVTASNISPNEFSQTFRLSPQTKFAQKIKQTTKFGKSFSQASKFKLGLNKQSAQKESEFIEKVTTVKRSQSQHEITRFKRLTHKMSFAKLLNEVGQRPKNVEIVPLQHQENPMFKKIKKLQELSTSRQQKSQHFRSMHQIERTPSRFMGRYQTINSTYRKRISQRTLSKMD